MKKIKKLIKNNPLTAKYYEKFVRFLKKTSKNKKITKIIINQPFNLGDLMLKAKFASIRNHLDSGNQQQALDELLLMQKQYIANRQVLHRISDIYKFDKQIEKAYIFILLSESVYPVYGAVRRLTFESDHQMLDKGIKTLDKVLDFKINNLARFMTMINRVSCFYPEKSDALADTRVKVKNHIEKNILKDNINFNKNMKFLLSNRWFASAMAFKKAGLDCGFKLSEDISTLYKKIETNLTYSDSSNIIIWLEVADENERSNTLLGMKNGLPVDVSTLEEKALKVELFIPSAFFSPPENEKPSFKIAQEYFRTICQTIASFEDVVVIPRHQFNWRKVHRKTDFKAISYHTFSDENNPNWLHIQESTLANRCSVDTKGFAGYAKIANDFSSIEQFTKNIEQPALDENFNYLYNKYVVNNVSKYEQKEELFSTKGEYVFVALQVLTDIVADIAFFDGIQMLKTVAQHYKNSGTKVVVKRHPYCTSLSMQLAVEELLKEGSIIVSEASIHSIIENAKAVFVVNSGVGFEALMHSKPVIVCGECDYAYAVAKQAKTPQELLAYLENDTFLIDELKIKQLLYYYVNKHNPQLEKLPELISNWIYNE